MSYDLYKLIHIVGVIAVFASLGALVMRSLSGSTDDRHKIVGLTHGLALIVLLVSGFGLLAKVGLGMDLWVWGKLALWLFIGGSIALIRRTPQLATLWWWMLPVLGTVAAYLALFKPGAG